MKKDGLHRKVEGRGKLFFIPQTTSLKERATQSKVISRASVTGCLPKKQQLDFGGI